MLDFLNKFNQLPQEVKDKISSPAVMAAIDDLEKKYQLNLATLILKIMVKEVIFSDLVRYFGEELKMDKDKAEKLTFELKNKVFYSLFDYLGIKFEAPTQFYKVDKEPTPVEKEVKLLERIPHEIINKPSSTLLEMKVKTELEEEIEELSEEFKDSKIKNSLKPLPANQEKGSSFYFDPEDEEEIQQSTRKIDNQDKLSENLLDKKLDEAISQSQVSFSSQLLVDRCKQILATYIKGIRNRLDTRLTLAKEITAGGLALDEMAIDRMTGLIDKLKRPIQAEKLQAPKKIILPEDRITVQKYLSLKEIGVRDVEYDFASMGKKPEVKEVVAQEKVLEPPLKLVMDRPAEVKPAEKISFRKPPEISNRVKVEDVKIIPKTMGPIEELRFLDLVSFRRLDIDPTDAAIKIKEKIKLLELEQYSKRLEAIKAWRMSPVYQLYLGIGEAAISQNASVESIIEYRKKNNEEYLNANEFEAIMSLNKELRF